MSSLPYVIFEQWNADIISKVEQALSIDIGVLDADSLRPRDQLIANLLALVDLLKGTDG